MQDFRPQPDQPCFCQSGKAFRDCCGSTAADRKPPHGIHIVENFILPSACRDLVDYGEACFRKRLSVVDTRRSRGGRVKHKMIRERVTDAVDFGPRQQEIRRHMVRAYREVVEPVFRSPMAWLEEPQVLRYEIGGFYENHSDSGAWNETTRLWKKVLDRDVSTLVYLNEDFAGGTLRFTKFNYELRPRSGMLVCFPSDPRYLHQAQPVTAGFRYAIVCWAAAANVPRVLPTPPKGAIMLQAGR